VSENGVLVPARTGEEASDEGCDKWEPDAPVSPRPHIEHADPFALLEFAQVQANETGKDSLESDQAIEDDVA